MKLRQIRWLGVKSHSEENSDWWQKCLLTPQAYVLIKELWLGSKGKVALSCWLQCGQQSGKKWSQKRKSAPYRCVERHFPNSDGTGRGWGSWQAGRGAGAHPHQAPEVMERKLWVIQKIRSRSLLLGRQPPQAAGVGARLDERTQGENYFQSFYIKSISSSRYDFSLFTKQCYLCRVKTRWEALLYLAGSSKLRVPL